MALARSMRSVAITLLGLMIVAGGFGGFYLSAGGALQSPLILKVALGLLLIFGGIVFSVTLHRLLSRQQDEMDIEAGRLLLGARSRDFLSETLIQSVDELLARCQAIDQRLLGATVVQMIHEYEHAQASDQRQAALMNIVVLLEKLLTRLSPWYVRQERLISFMVTFVGLISGITTIVLSILGAVGSS